MLLKKKLKTGFGYNTLKDSNIHLPFMNFAIVELKSEFLNK